MRVFFLFLVCVFTYHGAQSAIKIDSFQKTNSRCINSGSIKVFASSTSQIFFSIESGPITVSPQVSNTFNSLGAGYYKVVAMNLNNERDSIYVTINSAYVITNFNQIVTNANCNNTNDGKVIGNLVPGTGVAPFIWKLKNNNTGNVITKTNDTFTNLPIGDYTLTLTDSCLNTTVHNFEITGSIHGFNAISTYFRNISCGKSKVEVYFNKLEKFYPIRVKYKYKNTVVVKVPDSLYINMFTDTLNFKLDSSAIITTLYNKCGDSIVDTNHMSPKYMSICTKYTGCDTLSLSVSYYPIKIKKIICSYQSRTIVQDNINSNIFTFELPNLSQNQTINIKLFDDCNDSLMEIHTLNSFSNLVKLYNNIGVKNCMNVTNYYLYNLNCEELKSPITYFIYNKITSKLVDSGDLSGSQSRYIKTKNGDTNYRLVVKDGCNRTVKDTTFYWAKSVPINNNLLIGIYKDYSRVCLDSTIAVSLYVQPSTNSVRIKNFTGPKNISNSKSKYAYKDSMMYSYFLNSYGSSFYFYNLGVGKYRITVWDSCSEVSDSFEILPSEVSNNYYKINYIKACQDNNKLVLNLFSKHSPSANGYSNKRVNGWYSIYNVESNTYIASNKYFSYKDTDSFRKIDTLKYLSEGKYLLNLYYSDRSYQDYYTNSPRLNSNYNYRCSEIQDSIIIPPYSRPNLNVIVKVKCNNNTYVIFLPDSASGVFPYKYEINKGPVTFPPQTNNLFLINQLGDYQAKIWDTCGNANTVNFSIDTIKFQPEYTNERSCDINKVIIKYQSSPFFTYKWKKPNGTIYYGDSLKIDSVKYEDIGLYEITKYVNFQGCKDSFKNTYSINNHKYYRIFDTIYKGDSIYFKLKYNTNSGIYIDTIHQNPCDSFSILNLTVIDTNQIDSSYIIMARCFGDTFYYKDSAYYKSGIYLYKTRTYKGKKTVVTIKLIFDFYIRNQYNISICQGQSYKGHSISGIYSDTLKSSQTCDSISELILKVNPVYKNTASRVICAHETFKFGRRILNTTGLYIDTFKNIFGCDSVEELNLLVLPKPYELRDTFNTCLQYKYKDKMYYSTVDFVDTTRNLLNCDSIYRNIHLDIGAKPLIFKDKKTFCDYVIIDGIKYNNSFTYKDTIKFSKGLKCDSLYIYIDYEYHKNSKVSLEVFPNVDEYNEGEEVILTAKNALNYYWSTGSTLNKIRSILKSDTLFYVLAWNDSFCIDSVGINLKVLEPAILDIPKAFSPNGLMLNQVYKPNWKGKIEILNFEIYNRWGEKVYGTNSLLNIGWDGKYKGEDAPAGVYSYILKYKANRNIYFKSGEVLLVR